MSAWNRLGWIAAIIFLCPSEKEEFPGKMEKAMQLQDASERFDSLDDFTVCRFREVAEISGKSYNLTGVRINKTMYLAVICDEAEKDHFPKLAAVNLSEAMVLQLVDFAYFCKLGKVNGGKNLGGYSHPDDEMLRNILKDGKLPDTLK